MDLLMAFVYCYIYVDTHAQVLTYAAPGDEESAFSKVHDPSALPQRCYTVALQRSPTITLFLSAKKHPWSNR